MISDLDIFFLQNINGISQKSLIFDKFVVDVLGSSSARVLPIVACLIWVWFSNEQYSKSRIVVVKTIISGFISIVLSRLIQNLSPYRPRPMHTEGLNFKLPHGDTADQMREWSSFPSDTTALAFALAIGVWLSSKKVGYLCLVWATVFVGLPRVYRGLHYPADIVVGAVIGILSTVIFVFSTRNVNIFRNKIFFIDRNYPLLYSAGFVILFQMTVFFEDIRTISRSLFSFIIK